MHLIRPQDKGIRVKFSVGLVPRIDLDVFTTNMRRDTLGCGRKMIQIQVTLKHQYSAGSM